MAGVLTINYGLPGTGKTLFAMNDIVIPAVRENRPFFTNITGISLSGLFAVTGVHQSMIRYYPVKDISDVISYFDNGEVCANGVFILDEMKDFVSNERAISWLESRINVMRKQCVDFVLIAQLPEKEYIHPHIIELADSSNVAVSRKKYGDTRHVDWYYVDGGLPRIVNKIPRNSAGKSVRKKPEEVFSCYKTSESAFYTGQEDKTYRGLMWWQTRSAKYRFAILFIVVLVLVFFGFAAYKVRDLAFGTTKKTKSTLETGVKDDKRREDKSHQSRPIVLSHDVRPSSSKFGREGIGKVSSPFAERQCYSWKICDGALCRTDVGAFALAYRGDGTYRLCAGSRCVEPCKNDNDLSRGRGLLRPRDTLSR